MQAALASAADITVAADERELRAFEGCVRVDADCGPGRYALFVQGGNGGQLAPSRSRGTLRIEDPPLLEDDLGLSRGRPEPLCQ